MQNYKNTSLLDNIFKVFFTLTYEEENPRYIKQSAYSIFTIRARGATLILFDNGIRTWGIYTIKKHAQHLPTGRALTSLTRGGGNPPRGDENHDSYILARVLGTTSVKLTSRTERNSARVQKRRVLTQWSNSMEDNSG